jgi:hypothetical protein
MKGFFLPCVSGYIEAYMLVIKNLIEFDNGMIWYDFKTFKVNQTLFQSKPCLWIGFEIALHFV